ncbi:hypothetical protein BAY60_29495 [Prauserella muralis]|uniref:Uncharacterized protein n=2 Tax=Prauserella muralis TaxID=588067 RepID=A0A2V4AIF6_9PSEU|nr:hypothetical protein BAY60_29495 [Prauserella muralis]TWE28846.1 acetyl-CoA synthetase [Prauserella muralis]
MVWERARDELAQEPTAGFNCAFECCTRWRTEPGRVAVTFCHADGSFRRWTYAELDALASRCATVFAKAGLRQGDRVAALLSRQVESVIVALAAWATGLVYVPLYCGFGSAAIAERVRVSGARLAVVDRRWREPFDQALAELPVEPRVLTVGGRGPDEFWSGMDHVADEVPIAETAAGDLATLLFTSGTTGVAKACQIPHRGLVSLIPFVRHSLGLTNRSLLFTTADPAWSYGLYSTGMVPMALGVPRVVYQGDFDPTLWMRVIREHAVSAMGAAPSAYRRLAPVLASGPSAPSLITAGSGGEPLLAETASDWAEAGGPPILDAYGLSELGIVLGDTNTPPSGTRAGTLAGPIPGFDVVLADEHGIEVPQGERGRIAVRRPRFSLSDGYENDPAAWAKRWRGDLYVTEDIAVIEEGGRWRFVGRADDIIVTSGFNVSPVEVETALVALPQVVDAAVVAADDAQQRRVVRAVVVPREGVAADDSLRREIEDHVRARVARYAVPRQIDFVAELPRTETGKLKRSALTGLRSRQDGGIP